MYKIPAFHTLTFTVL